MNDYMDEETLILKTQIELSSHRVKVLKAFEGRDVIRPKQIAELTGMNINHVSRSLGELRSMDLVKVLNPNVRANRNYTLTNMGKHIINYLD